MVGLIHDAELDARKRVLAAESEIYRQTLKLEVHNLRLYGAVRTRIWSGLESAGPLLGLAVPVARLFSRPRSIGAEDKATFLSAVWFALKLYLKYGRWVRSFFNGGKSR